AFVPDRGTRWASFSTTPPDTRRKVTAEPASSGGVLLWTKHSKEDSMVLKLHDSPEEIEKRKDRDANRDPLTGTPAAAAPATAPTPTPTGCAPGAAAGSLAGPAGTL